MKKSVLKVLKEQKLVSVQHFIHETIALDWILQFCVTTMFKGWQKSTVSRVDFTILYFI